MGGSLGVAGFWVKKYGSNGCQSVVMGRRHMEKGIIGTKIDIVVNATIINAQILNAR